MRDIEDRRLIKVPEELAEALNITCTQAQGLVNHGDVKSVKIGKHRHTTHEAVDEFLDNLNLQLTPGIFHTFVDSEVL